MADIPTTHDNQNQPTEDPAVPEEGTTVGRNKPDEEENKTKPKEDPEEEKKKETIKTHEEPEKEKDETEEKKPKGGCITPKPSGEELSEGEMETIIKKTLDVLQMIQTKTDEEKLDSHNLTFMLLRVRETLESYCTNYIPTLNSFLWYADAITADYYARMCCCLQCYGDNVKTLEKEECETIDIGEGNQVSKERLLNLMQGVTDNYYAAALIVRSLRAELKDVNSITMIDRKSLCCRLSTPFPEWIGIQDSVMCQLEGIRENAFKISTYIDFLKQGEGKKGPTLDLSRLKAGKEKIE